MILARPPAVTPLASTGSLPAALDDVAQAGRVAREYLVRVRAEVRARHEAGAGGLELVAVYTDAVDRLVRFLFANASAHFMSRFARLNQQCTVVAQGGYGRGELNPGSDIDLLFLYPWKVNPYVETVAETKAPAAPAPTARAPTFPAHVKIVLDPGHGGHDPGARGYAVEKEVTLAIAHRLARLLDEKLGAEVVLTRSADATLPLAARTERANAEGADLFVSIHANASPHRWVHGVETYYLNNTHDRGTIRLAAMENGLSLPMPARGGPDLRYIVSDLVQAAKMDESIALATAVQRGLVDHLGARWRGIADLGVKRGPFYVLVGAYMPCVLVETSFLTHPTEGRRLSARAYRDAVAEGIYTGIARFLADARRARTL